jgi:hypothetical protein
MQGADEADVLKGIAYIHRVIAVGDIPASVETFQKDSGCEAARGSNATVTLWVWPTASGTFA